MSNDAAIINKTLERVAERVGDPASVVFQRLFADSPDGAYSVNVLWDRAIEQERLFGIRHDGEWYHVSTPQHLKEVERELGFHGIRF